MKVLTAAAVLFLGASAPARVAVGQWSYGLAAGGGSVWVGGLSLGDVYRIDPKRGRVVAHIKFGPRIFNLAAGGGAVWAISNIEDTLARIDLRSGKVTQRVRVGIEPYDVGWAFGSVWVANAGDGTVWRVTNGKVVAKVRIGAEPNGLTAYRGSVWVSDHTEGKVVRIDTRTDRITATVRLPGADWITGFGRGLYVSQETNHVAWISLDKLRVLRSVRVGKNPLGSAIVGKELWVPCIDANEIDLVDPSTLRVVARKHVGPSPIVVLPAYGHVWVSHTTANYVTRL
jgi:DNA-binding beta-propeller fold protein YncE